MRLVPALSADLLSWVVPEAPKVNQERIYLLENLCLLALCRSTSIVILLS